MDEAHVDAQIGYVDGNVTIYSVSDNDQPDRKYQVGLNYLKGDMPRRAETLIRDAAMFGCRSSEVAYYWTLAILSGRSFDHLGPDEFTHLSAASTMAAEFPHDAWRQAFDVVIELINCITEEEEHGAPDLTRFSAAFDAYRGLPKVRRDEIHRHLEMILNGWIQDRVEELEAQYVQAKRFSGDRGRRVWKFFEPTPAAPRRLPAAPPVLDAGKRFQAVLGSVLAGLGVLWIVSLTASSSLIAVIIVLALAGVWLTTTIMYALPRRSADRGRPPGGWNQNFGAAVSSSVDHWFQVSGPANPIAAQQFAWDSVPVREKLKADLVYLYGGDHSRVGPIRWLIKWHAENAARQFGSGVPLRREDVPIAVLAGNGALLIAGFIVLIGAGSASFLGLLGAGLLMGIGAATSWNDSLNYLAAALNHPRTVSEADRRWAAEQQEYQRWSGVLADRPSDAEMAAWLDHDKMMIKSLALKHYGLSNRDVIAHLTLTEGAPRCRRARVLYGPLRYSAYVVLLFLLTEGGVRQVTVDLDFFSGAIHDERRTTFRYEMIASARVAEVAVRFEHGHRHVMAREEIQPHVQQTLILSRAFRLSLVNGQHIDVLVDSFEQGLIDRTREDITFLTALALDTSGVTGALRILEAVSAEGREWLAHERARRQRRLRDFRASQKIPGAIGSAGMLALPEPSKPLDSAPPSSA
ncbi:hypothetical protein AB0K18_40265 [Nonomuraea sp. NPDC049421]|uniref:hypothetical protein n=1 Tax=Nonomuraea sp. NPDC049421 TaxID=3155275 RepID=UPI00341A3919